MQNKITYYPECLCQIKRFILSSVLLHFHVSTKIWTIASFLLRVLQMSFISGVKPFMVLQINVCSIFKFCAAGFTPKMKSSSFSLLVVIEICFRKKRLLTLVTFKKVWRNLCVNHRYHKNKNVCLISK